jgi:hypothetical protein
VASIDTQPESVFHRGVAGTGDTYLIQRANIRIANEIERLANSFNEMTDELAHAIKVLVEKGKEVQVVLLYHNLDRRCEFVECL